MSAAEYYDRGLAARQAPAREPQDAGRVLALEERPVCCHCGPARCDRAILRVMDSEEVIKLGKKGQLSVPKGVMRRLGLKGGEALLLDVTEDGAIVLRPAGVYPLEIYSDERTRQFLKADELSEEERDALSRRFFPGAPGGKGSA